MTTTRHTDPAQPLYDAAKTLRELAAKVPQGNWEPGERCIWVADSDETVVADTHDGAGGATTPENADFIATMDPPLAEAFATLLEECAAFNHYNDENPQSAEHTAAHLILERQNS